MSKLPPWRWFAAASAALVSFAAAERAHADRSLEVGLGGTLPMKGREWRDDSRPGFKLGGRGSSEVRGVPIMVGLAWLHQAREGFQGFDRFRLGIGAGSESRMGAVLLAARGTIGLEAVAATTVVAAEDGLPARQRVIDLGAVAEAAVAMWLAVNDDFDIGLELSTPFAVHRGTPSVAGSRIDLTYVGFDVEVLVAVRFR